MMIIEAPGRDTVTHPDQEDGFEVTWTGSATNFDDLVLLADPQPEDAPSVPTKNEGAASGRSLSQIVIDLPSSGSPVLDRTDPVQSRFVQRVLRLLSERPVESGSCHPAEQPIREWITSRGAREFVAFFDSRLARRPGTAADLLRCLAVSLPSELVQGWGHAIAERALSHESVDVRNAAVEALERWADTNSYLILRKAKETVPWLRDYIDRVLAEFMA